MLIKNVDEILVNGCVGRVVGFYTYREALQTLYGGNEKRAGPPKTTGFVRNVKIDPDGALLRTKGGDGDKENALVEGIKNAKETVNASHSQKIDEKFPLVEFPTTDGSKEAVLVMREEFKVEDAEGKILARRMQVSCGDLNKYSDDDLS